MIVCSTCSVERPESQFYPSVLKRGGESKRCKACFMRSERLLRRKQGIAPRRFIYRTEMGQECGRCGVMRCFEDYQVSQLGSKGTWCRDCMHGYRRERQQEYGFSYRAKNATRGRNRKWFASLKARSACIECGEKHPATLEWHHLDPLQKEESLAWGVASAKPIEWLEAELAKCICLCANCHRKHHHGYELNVLRALSAVA